MRTRISIFTLQMLSYLSIIPMVLFAHWYHWLIAMIMYFLFNCIGMIMTYHRLLTHRTFNCPIWFEYIGTSLATLSLTGSGITWVAIHRKHHRFADTLQDPHSPDHLGFWRVQFLTAFAPVEGKYAVDLMRSRFHLWIHKNYVLINVVVLTVLLLLDPFSAVYLYLFPACLTLFFGTLVLSVAHKDYKPRTVHWLAFLTFGDAYHDIHHDNSQLYRLHKYDITGWLIETMFIKR